MIKSILLAALILPFGLQSYAQTSYFMTLDFNNVSTVVNDHGLFFNNPAPGIGRYEVPKGSGLNLIYAGDFWFGGLDENEQLKFAGQTYDLTSYGPGPLTIGTAQPAASTGQTIWALSRNEIMYHIANYDEPGYSMPANILYWPAHGNVSEGFSQNLAPFNDSNNNGLYEPELGDYPCIKGDRAIFMIMNDKSGQTVNPDAIGLELHFMFYQFATNDYLNNTTFIDLTVFNRNMTSIHDFKTSFFVDGDLGNYADDYFGCDSTKNVGYFYNGDSFDENYSGNSGYQENPPAFGIVSLKQEMSSFGVYDEVTTGNQEMYEQMSSNFPNGMPWTNLSGQATNYMYSGNPYDLSGESEWEESNPPGDRRALITHDKGDFNSGDTLELSYAIIYQRNGLSTIDNTNDIIQLATTVQQFYDQELNYSCMGAIAHVEDQSVMNFNIYPNPHTEQFTIQFNELQDEIKVEILDLSGKTIQKVSYTASKIVDVKSDLPAGIYLLKIETEKGTLNQKIIKE